MGLGRRQTSFLRWPLSEARLSQKLGLVSGPFCTPCKNRGRRRTIFFVRISSKESNYVVNSFVCPPIIILTFWDIYSFLEGGKVAARCYEFRPFLRLAGRPLDYSKASINVGFALLPLLALLSLSLGMGYREGWMEEI